LGGEQAELNLSSRGSAAVGIVVALLIIGAVATLGYYQFEVAGSSSSTTTTSSAPGVTCPSSACVNATIFSGASSPPANYQSGQKTTYGYAPDVINVVIGKNNTVFWVNNDAAPHTVTSDTAGVFGSPTMNQGDTFQETFTTAGTYTYHCIFHPWMQGTVIVKSA
jgi:plastocyanin